MGEKWTDSEYILEMESAELGDRFDMFEGARGHQGWLLGSLTSVGWGWLGKLPLVRSYDILKIFIKIIYEVIFERLDNGLVEAHSKVCFRNIVGRLQGIRWSYNCTSKR